MLKNDTFILRRLGLVLVSMFALASCSSLFKEAVPEMVNCGDVLERSFSQNFEKHDFHIKLVAGQKLEVAVRPVGDYLFTALELYEPASDAIILQMTTNQAPGFKTEVLSATGDYRIRVRNYGLAPDMRINYQDKGRAGIYSLELGCTEL